MQTSSRFAASVLANHSALNTAHSTLFRTITYFWTPFTTFSLFQDRKRLPRKLSEALILLNNYCYLYFSTYFPMIFSHFIPIFRQIILTYEIFRTIIEPELFLFQIICSSSLNRAYSQNILFHTSLLL